MAQIATIAPGELLLITVEWTGGIHRGTRNLMELDIRAYEQGEIQDIIDDTISETCRIAPIDRYGRDRRVGEDISDIFDLRAHSERQSPYREPPLLSRPFLSAFDRSQAARIRDLAR
ncbi:hypothetical protein [Oryzifoliimicrobium ureilyticus]|uniref:hypothetical protein n=1 Tax=Oryzifoliimicrobium ureilyticus TaxID=3113724 RepID=UPI003076429E